MSVQTTKKTKIIRGTPVAIKNHILDMQYAWFIWSVLLVGVWGVIYLALDTKDKKRETLIVGLWTALTGLTEPLFVPAYWNPPSLFDLATRTGFDLESIIFSFGTGGIAVILYEWIFRTAHRKIPVSAHNAARHRYHVPILFTTPAVLLALLLMTDINPIYSAILALIAGGLATWYCRPDLKKKMFASAALFLGLYFAYFWTLIALFPGYVERVWNMQAISGILLLGIPIEELAFAWSFGFLWSSVYEHFTWRKIKPVS